MDAMGYQQETKLLFSSRQAGAERALTRAVPRALGPGPEHYAR